MENRKALEFLIDSLNEYCAIERANMRLLGDSKNPNYHYSWGYSDCADQLAAIAQLAYYKANGKHYEIATTDKTK